MKNLSIEEVKDFFKETEEFTVDFTVTVKEVDDCLKISYTDNGKTTSTLIWNKNLNHQQLIRAITELVWNHCNGNFDLT